MQSEGAEGDADGGNDQKDHSLALSFENPIAKVGILNEVPY